MLHNYLNGTDFSIDQDENMYHFNSDTELLGRFMRVHNQDHVLDIGTNNGALLFYALQKGATHITGIDLFQEVLDLAQHNFDNYQKEVHLFQTPLQDFMHEPFDVILCNPPYFNTTNDALKNENQFIKAARHEQYLNLNDLIYHVNRLLKDNGTFYFVHRPSRLNDIFFVLQEHDMQVTRLQIAYGSIQTEAKSILLEVKKGKGAQVKICPPVFMNDHDSFLNI